MSIKTWEQWQENEPLLSTPYAMQAEIDELRAALQERDAEIERLKYTVKRRDVGIEICATLSVKMEAKLAAQRKVLEQVLNTLIDVTASINMKRFWRDKDGKRFDEITDTAITAIQGVLK